MIKYIKTIMDKVFDDRETCVHCNQPIENDVWRIAVNVVPDHIHEECEVEYKGRKVGRYALKY